MAVWRIALAASFAAACSLDEFTHAAPGTPGSSSSTGGAGGAGGSAGAGGLDLAGGSGGGGGSGGSGGAPACACGSACGSVGEATMCDDTGACVAAPVACASWAPCIDIGLCGAACDSCDPSLPGCTPIRGAVCTLVGPGDVRCSYPPATCG